MPNNNKKEYPINGLEQDVISKRSRKIIAKLQNNPDLVKFAKNSVNRRFRKRNNFTLMYSTEEE